MSNTPADTSEPDPAEWYWDPDVWSARQKAYFWMWFVAFCPVCLLLLGQKPEGRYRRRSRDEIRLNKAEEEERRERLEEARREHDAAPCDLCLRDRSDHATSCPEYVHVPEVFARRTGSWLLEGGGYVPGRTYYYVRCSCGDETAAHDTPEVAVEMYEQMHGYRVRHKRARVTALRFEDEPADEQLRLPVDSE